MKTKWVKKAVVLTFAGVLACSLPAGGRVSLAASANTSVKDHEKVWGKIILKAGPEISLSYDWQGEVLEAKGLNRDGTDLLEGADSLAGVDCDTAVRRLIKRMDDKQWFDGSDAGRKQLVIKSEKNSVYPEAGFMDELKKAAQAVSDRRDIKLDIKVEDNGQLAESGYIGREDAKKIALRELGLKEESVTYRECDLENGVYELEFLVNGVKVDVDVNADNGKVVDVDWDDNRGDGVRDDERDGDDRDDDDRDDDDRNDDDRDDDDRDDDDRNDDDRDDDDWGDDDRGDDDWGDDDQDDND